MKLSEEDCENDLQIISRFSLGVCGPCINYFASGKKTSLVHFTASVSLVSNSLFVFRLVLKKHFSPQYKFLHAGNIKARKELNRGE